MPYEYGKGAQRRAEMEISKVVGVPAALVLLDVINFTNTPGWWYSEFRVPLKFVTIVYSAEVHVVDADNVEIREVSLVEVEQYE